MNFVLPESITNVKTHSDIREFILSKCSIQKIAILGKKFKNVFSSVITMQIKKGTDIKSSIEVVNKDNKYLIEQIRFSKNRHSLFDIYVDQVDNDIFIKISKAGYVSLANQSDWALGIVTGDNKKFIVCRMITNLVKINRKIRLPFCFFTVAKLINNNITFLS